MTVNLAKFAPAHNLTTLEAEFMDLIARCEMNVGNGARPECADDVNTYVWAAERAADLNISEKGVGGVMSSLIQKGYIWMVEDPDGDGVGFTDAGFEQFKAARPE